MTDEEINCAGREGGNAALGGRKRSHWQAGLPNKGRRVSVDIGFVHLSFLLPSRFVAVVPGKNSATSSSQYWDFSAPYPIFHVRVLAGIARLRGVLVMIM